MPICTPDAVAAAPPPLVASLLAPVVLSEPVSPIAIAVIAAATRMRMIAAASVKSAGRTGKERRHAP